MIFRAYLPTAMALAHAMIAAAPAAADTYALDPQHTEVRFTWDHLGLSRQGGRFTSAEGTVTFDPAKPEASAVEVKIPVRSIATGVKKLDEHLVTTKEFFDVAAYPNITFKSTSVRTTSDKTGQVEGDLSINGITKSVVLDVVWNFTGEHPLQTINPVYAGAFASGFSASTQIRRSDWGITRTIPYVSDELRITIETEMLRTAETPAADTPPAAGAPIESGGPPSLSPLPEAATVPEMAPLPDAAGAGEPPSAIPDTATDGAAPLLPSPPGEK